MSYDSTKFEDFDQGKENEERIRNAYEDEDYASAHFTVHGNQQLPQGASVASDGLLHFVTGTAVKPIDFADLASNGTTFSSNAMRSEKKLPFWRFSLRAMIEWAKRFKKGEKYDEAKGITHNWKLAIESHDVEFVRQFFDHAMEHMLNAKERAAFGPELGDHEGENMFDHLGAAMWNIASLIEYLDKNPTLVCKALSQKPEKI